MTGADDVFDAPARWRLLAARALGLEGEELIAGVTTGAAYPVAIEPIVVAITSVRASLVLDIGSGTGGVAEWMARRTGAVLVGLEPSPTAAGVAAATFDRVHSVQGAAEALPFRPGSFDAVTLLGATSLVADLDRLLTQVATVVRPGGIVGLSDLCLDERQPVTEHREANTFRSLATLVAAMEHHRFVVDDLAVGAADLTTRWSSVIHAVDDEIERRFGDAEAFAAWATDRDALRRRIEAGELGIGTVVARRGG